MGSGYHNQIHAPVQSAVEGKVRLLGINPVVIGIVHAHHQGVVFFQILQLHPEGAVAALMAANLLTIEHHLTGVGSPQELQPDLIARIDRRFGQLPGIIAGAPVVIIAAVLTVNRVPGMGQGDSLGSLPGTPLGKQPIVMNWEYFTHNRTPLLKRLEKE